MPYATTVLWQAHQNPERSNTEGTTDTWGKKTRVP